jgi:hypothetical protein
MSIPPKSRWLASIFLAGLLLTPAGMGGEWGMKYEARAALEPNPHIDFILSSYARVGSPSFLMVIGGSNFGTQIDTAVRLVGNG